MWKDGKISIRGGFSCPSCLFSGALSPELGWTSGTHLTGEGKTGQGGWFSQCASPNSFYSFFRNYRAFVLEVSNKWLLQCQWTELGHMAPRGISSQIHWFYRIYIYDIYPEHICFSIFIPPDILSSSSAVWIINI